MELIVTLLVRAIPMGPRLACFMDWALGISISLNKLNANLQKYLPGRYFCRFAFNLLRNILMPSVQSIKQAYHDPIGIALTGKVTLSFIEITDFVIS